MAVPPARSGTSGATAHNGLLALPAELRLEIYEYLLPRRTCTLYLNQTGLLEHPTPKSGVCSMRETPPPEAVPDWTHNAHLALQLLCKSVKSEALQIFGKIVSLDLRIGKDPAWASAWMVLQRNGIWPQLLPNEEADLWRELEQIAAIMIADVGHVL